MPLEDLFARLWGRSERDMERPPGAGSASPKPLGLEAPASQDGGGSERQAPAWHPPMREPSDAEPWHPPLKLPPRYTSAELAEGEEEIALLREVYGNVLNASAKLAYAHFTDKRWQYRTEEYLDDRAAFFGSTRDYLAYREVARAELDAEDGKLRRKIDPSEGTRAVRPRWRDAQVAFYAWTRRAYEKKVGAGVNVPALNAGMSKTLEAALRQVRADYGKGFNPQGFNPRPIKATAGYRLGTLSDHALGTAIDIRPATNAQIEAAAWRHILDYTGRTLDLASRRLQWTNAPRDLLAAIAGINDEFVKKLREAVAAEVQKGLDDGAALGAVVKADTHRSKLKESFVKRWRGGFFDLPWELVKELHEEKFIWGATFARLDLHHFELP